MSGQFTNPADAARPGLYLKFIELATLQLSNAGVGTVGIPLVAYGTADAEKVTEIKSVSDAEAKFGTANIQSIKFALENAERVLVYTLPSIDGTTVTEQIAYDKARVAFDTEKFDVFVYDGIVSASEQDNAILWLDKSIEEGRHFTVVFGCVNANDDQDPSIGNTRSTRLNHEYAINVINGAKVDGVVFNSAQYAPAIAGIVANCPMNKSITFTQLPVEDVNKRLTYTETKTALVAGSLVLTNTGEKIRIEQGLVTTGGKLRKSLIRQGVSVDVTKAIEDNIIGKYTNNKDTQMFVISMVKTYLETLAKDGIIKDITVALSTAFESKGDEIYLDISYVELDSVEKVFLSIAV